MTTAADASSMIADLRIRSTFAIALSPIWFCIMVRRGQVLGKPKYAGHGDMMPMPFIVTAELPPDVLAWADGLRRRHFPPERNWLKAHVTLFHAFAPSLREELETLLPALAARYAPPAAQLDGVMNLGRGTALKLASPSMLGIRAQIADHFHGCLTAQDSHAVRLHITIQNKVDPTLARALQTELAPQLSSRSFRFTGLGLHRYCNPHWESAGVWSFRGKEDG